MAIVCVGAVLAGLVAAQLIPFLPFACAVVAAIVVGFASMMVEGATFGRALASAVILLVACQLGYGFGLVLAARFGAGTAARRVGAPKRAAPAVRPLRTGKPR